MFSDLNYNRANPIETREDDKIKRIFGKPGQRHGKCPGKSNNGPGRLLNLARGGQAGVISQGGGHNNYILDLKPED